MRWILLTIALIHGASRAGECTTKRDAGQVRAFIATHPCPTGQNDGCDGYVVDHVIPLCACGTDAPENMQWQARAEAIKKDRIEKALCAWIRRAK